MTPLLIEELALPPLPSEVPAVALNVWAEEDTQGSQPVLIDARHVTGPLGRHRTLYESGERSQACG